MGALAAVQLKEKLRARILDARVRLRGQAHLVAVTLVNFVLTSANGVHVGFRGRCREEQELGKLRGIVRGVDGSIFGGALPRHSQRRIQHRSQRHAQELFRRLTP